MTIKLDKKVAQEVLRIRFSQMIVNQGNKDKHFKCPVHLAFGHEAIAVAVSGCMKDKDGLLLTHRNIHYNLARSKSLKKKIDEYLCKETGEASGQLGCMNLHNKDAGVLYTSSILGNQMAVATGVALGNRIKKTNAVTIVVIGDGAIEEGIFYESLVMMKTYRLATLIIVENNGWSLATQIHERRCDIKLDLLAASLNIPYYHLKGNDVYEYIRLLGQMHSKALSDESPVIVEVALNTLGDWVMKTEEHSAGKYINYHAGAAPNVQLVDWPVIEESDFDPVHVLKKHFEFSFLKELSEKVFKGLREELV
jgi:pyruvate dehydrogenase E1 component alpha subunit